MIKGMYETIIEKLESQINDHKQEIVWKDQKISKLIDEVVEKRGEKKRLQEAINEKESAIKRLKENE